MNKPSPLDKGLHNSLYEFEASVNDAHWDKLEAALDKKAGKRVFYLWILVPLFIAGTVSGIYWFNRSAAKETGIAKSDNVYTPETKVNTSASEIEAITKKEVFPSVQKPLEKVKNMGHSGQERVVVSLSSVEPEGVELNESRLKTNQSGLDLSQRNAIKFVYLTGDLFLPVADAKEYNLKLKPLKPFKRDNLETGVMPTVGFYSVNYIGMNMPESYWSRPTYSDGLVNAVTSADVQGANYGIGFYGRKYLSNKLYIGSGFALNIGKQTIHYVISSNLKGFNIKDGYLNYTNLEIPFGVGYRLTSSTSKTRFFIEPGINVMAIRHTKANLFNLETELQENVKMTTPLINPKLGLNFSYPLSSGLMISGVYQVRYAYYKTSSSFNYKIGGTQHQLGVGLSMKL